MQPQGQLSKAEDYEHLIVSQNNGAPVYLKDIAKVDNSVQDERINMRFWLRGQHVPSATVVVAVFRQSRFQCRGGRERSARCWCPAFARRCPASVDVHADL